MGFNVGATNFGLVVFRQAVAEPALVECDRMTLHCAPLPEAYARAGSASFFG